MVDIVMETPPKIHTGEAEDLAEEFRKELTHMMKAAALKMGCPVELLKYRVDNQGMVEIQKMEQDTKLAELKTHNEMAVKEHNLSTFVQESTFAFKNSTLIVGALGSIILLALIFYIFRKR